MGASNQVNTSGGGTVILREGDNLVIAFDDYQLLTELFGEHDQHLARIEEGLGVHASSRGNKLVVTGKPKAREQADRVLRELYQRLKSGLDVTAGDVDGAIRMSKTPQNDDGGNATGRMIQTKKRSIGPRSATQKDYIEALMSNELVFGVGPAGTGKTYLACCRGG